MRLLLVLLVALVLVPAAVSADPHTQTIAGVITANSGSSLTVSASGRSLTCTVTSAKAQVAIVRWGIGIQAAMACKQAGDKLLLTHLTRKGGDTTTTTTPTTTTHATTTEPTHTTPTTSTHTTTEPTRTTFDARGKVTALVAGAITVLRPDGSALVCSITDGQLSSIHQGAPVGSYVLMVCGGTGDHPALISLQRIDTTVPPTTTTTHTTTTHTTTTPTPTTSDNRQAIGIVTVLSSTDGVTVKPDNGDALHCRITTAADSRAAAGKLTLGAHAGIVCRRDGDSYVLSGATSG